MIEEWQRQLETILLSGPVAGARVIGFVAPDAGAGVSTIAATAAEIAARSGGRTLLLDLSQPYTALPADDPWTEREALSGGFDRRQARTDRDGALRFNNVGWLRGLLSADEASTDIVILDLPPVAAARDRLNPLAAAAACDAVILVCARGRSTPGSVESTAATLRSARVRLAGCILNHRPASVARA